VWRTSKLTCSTTDQGLRRTLDKQSIYCFLHRERDRLFSDDAFADLFDDIGRPSVPPWVVAEVVVLQRLEGLSDPRRLVCPGFSGVEILEFGSLSR
jgi:hypothetical protein